MDGAYSSVGVGSSRALRYKKSMNQPFRVVASCATLAAIGLALAGCSGQPVSSDPIQVSDADMKSSAVHKANSILDNLATAPADMRQKVANSPRAAEALQAGAAADPAVKQRLDTMGITLAPPRPLK
jgi:hypothetical protein